MALHWMTLGGKRDPTLSWWGSEGVTPCCVGVLRSVAGGHGDTAEFLAALSKAKAESAPEKVRDEVRRACWRGWWTLLSCGVVSWSDQFSAGGA